MKCNFFILASDNRGIYVGKYLEWNKYQKFDNG